MPFEPWTRPGIDRIVLVGFMAAGKTTVGRALARRLGWAFTDFDDAIRERTGRSAGEIIREDGTSAFRRLETDLTRELAGVERLVLAPGGGWGADPRLAAMLGPGTIRVWLRVGAAEAVRRAEADAADRPLLGPDGAGRLSLAETLLAERERAYAAAELVVDVDGVEPDAVVDEITERLRTYAKG